MNAWSLLEKDNSWLKNQLFGRSSEKTLTEELNPDEAWLVNEAEALLECNEHLAFLEATNLREHPELAGTYLNLRAAELASRANRDLQDRRRFVWQVRSALAEDIERGEPLQPVRLREPTKEAKDHTPLNRE
jgi:hypothetical protein